MSETVVRAHLNSQMNEIRQRVLKMGVLVEEALQKALTALTMQDFDLARKVQEDDADIDNLQTLIEDQCIKVIATEQPVAGSLREIITTVKIVADIERIGDHARHLAHSIGSLNERAFQHIIPQIRDLAQKGIDMLHDSLSAFVEQDAEAAVEVARRDDEIDRAHRSLYREVLETMRQNPEVLDEGISIMFLNRFLERLGDHVTNVCDWVVYAKKGLHMELNRTEDGKGNGTRR